jgi:hypothetical protein
LSSAALATALIAAPAAQAESRDSGVGLQIAQQGNLALHLIRADARQAALRLMAAALPKPADAAVKMAAPAPGGATFVAATSMRCAK